MQVKDSVSSGGLSEHNAAVIDVKAVENAISVGTTNIIILFHLSFPRAIKKSSKHVLP